MNIYSKRGEKVFFTGIGGHPYQLEEAKKIFSVGQELTVDDIDVDISSSSVKFEEHDEWFNTVMFENTEAVVMNKRIEEIYAKCSYERPELVMDYINYKKFAQLIIEECCQALHPMLRDQISRGQGVDLIKKHFGVK
jgi:hypothetical protein